MPLRKRISTPACSSPDTHQGHSFAVASVDPPFCDQDDGSRHPVLISWIDLNEVHFIKIFGNIKFHYFPLS